MNFKKILALSLCFAMVLGTMSIPVFADGNVAKVGNTEYATIDKAIAAAQAGDTITLLTDMTFSGQNAADKLSGYVIDLNEKTITLSGNTYLTGETTIKNGNILVSGYVSDSYLCLYTADTKLTLDDVHLTGTMNCYAVLNAATGSTLIIKDSTIDVDGNVTSPDTMGNIIYGGNVTVDNSTIKGVNTVRGIGFSNITIQNGSTVNIFNVETGLNCATVTVNNSVVTIENATKRAVRLNNNALTLQNGATLTATNCLEDIIGVGTNDVVSVSNDSTLNAVDNITPTGLSGTGTEDDPYLINNLNDLIWFRDNVNTYTSDGSNQYKNKYVKLNANIDLSGISWTPIGTNSVGDHMAFLGTFDGGGHTISNLYVNADGDHLGFFARVGSYSEDVTPTVKNITFNNVDVSSNTTTGHGGSYVGGVIANAGGNSVVSDVNVTGDVYVVGYGYVGGIVGHGYPDLTNCHVIANDNSWVQCHYWCAGGIIGYAGEGGTPITDCSVSGLDIWSAYGGAAAVAGLLQDGNTVTNVSATNVKITSNSDYCMGYIAGNGEASTMSNITATNVTATAKNKPIASTDAVASIGNVIYFDLQTAVAAANSGDTITLMNGEHELPLFSGKELTFKGESKDGVIVNDAPDARAQGWNGSSFHFENLTAKGATENYHGLANGVVTVTYKDCNVNNLRFLYATDTVSFENCTFNSGAQEHSFWTYGASNISVTNCTFNYADRAVNCYSENDVNHETDISFSGCTFNYTGTKEAPEGAVEINSSYVKSIDVSFTTCTAPEKGAMWFNSRWDSTGGANTTIVVEDKQVWPINYVAHIGETYFETFEAALNAVSDGQTITLTGAEGDEELSKEIDFEKDIAFTITGKAPKYALPVVTFQNAKVTIQDAEILIPELDARQNATINVVDSIVHDAGGNSIVKSYYNGAINISGTSVVYTMQVTTMGYITISDTAKLNATWQTNVYGNGLITVKDDATFATAALQLTGKDYSGRDNTDTDRVGKPAEIVVDSANLIVGKVYSNSGADYSYNSAHGINIGTIEGKKAILTAKNDANVNIYMADKEKVNIGADGTVNVADSAFVTECRAANGAISVDNYGTINLTEEATLDANGSVKVFGTLKSAGDIAGTITKVDDAVIEITGGTYTQDVSAYLADGFLLAKNSDGTYKVGVLPNAEVKELGTITLNEYSIWGGGSNLTEGTEPIDLQVAMEFIAKDSESEAAANAFGNYTTDFYITIDGIKGDSFVADGCYLAGNYGTFGWIMIPLDGMTIEKGKIYPVISSVGFDFKYVDICTSVKDFKCGIYFSDKVLADNPDLNVTLELGLSENIEAAKSAEFITVDEPYTYNAEDLKQEEIKPLHRILLISNMELRENNGVLYYPVHVYAGIDSLNYKEVGFMFNVKNTENPQGEERTYKTKTVYTGMNVKQSDGTVEKVLASELGGKYMFGHNMNFKTSSYSNADTEIEITPYAIKLDGTTITGDPISITDKKIKAKYPNSALFKEETTTEEEN